MVDTFEDLGFAKLDMSRSERTGMPETVYCAGKSKEQLAGILKAFQDKNCPVLGTRCSPEQASFVEANGLDVGYDAVSKTVVLTGGKKRNSTGVLPFAAAERQIFRLRKKRRGRRRFSVPRLSVILMSAWRESTVCLPNWTLSARQTS